MVRAQLGLAKFQRAPRINFGLVVVAKVPVNEAEIARDEGEIDVIRPERFLFRFQDALKHRLRLFILMRHLVEQPRLFTVAKYSSCSGPNTFSKIWPAR